MKLATFYKKLVAFGVSAISFVPVFAQNNALVMNGGVYLTMNGGSSGTPLYLVINQSNASGISRSATTNRIINTDESEFNYIQWEVGTSTGSYLVPFGTTAADLPLTVNITGAGTGSGKVITSTYSTGDDNTPFMNGVGQLEDNSGAGNSAKVLDRWWNVNASGYTAKPTADLTFTYRDTEWSGGSNSITENNLQAQRWNSTSSIWGDFSPSGTVNITNNTVSLTGVSPSNFFKSWVLVDNSSPLPIELLSFTADCNKGKVELTWKTASETNNNFFTVERTVNNKTFETIGIVNGAGNSSSIQTYSLTDNNAPAGNVYYRLKQTDFDGHYSYSDLIVTSCNSNNIDLISIYPNPAIGNIDYLLYSSENASVNVNVMDAAGKTVDSFREEIKKGVNKRKLDVSNYSSGNYLIKVVVLSAEESTLIEKHTEKVIVVQ